MRLKSLVGVLLLLLILSALAAAANSQLSGVSITGQPRATSVVLHASGAFTHTEYRPVDNLLLVDLTGVAPGKLKDTRQAVNRPGLASYRVLGYTGASGTEVTRVELSLAPTAVVTVSETKGGLEVLISENADTPKPSVTPAALSAQTAPKVTPAVVRSTEPAAEPHAARAGKPVTVSHVGVVRGKGGMEVEISSTGPITPKAMMLTAPDRLVIDLPNAVPAGKTHPISVGGPDIQGIRMSRFQSNPPVTRVVVDLVAARQYELLPSARKLIVKLHPVDAATAAVAPAPAKPAAEPASAAPVLMASLAPSPGQAPKVTPAAMTTSTSAQDYVYLEPKYETKSPEAAAAPPPTASPAVPEPGSKSAAIAAANVIQAANQPLPQSNLLPSASAALNPPALNMAREQVQQQMQTTQAPAKAAAPRYTGEPISVNLKDVDLKDFFRLIHEISGLNIILDPGVRGSLTLVLDDVPWDQALDIVLQNNGLDKRLEGNVLRIAGRDAFTNEAEARRKQAEATALAVDKVQYTHFLSYAHAADVMPIVKKFLSARGDLTADVRTNALIIQDIPSTIPDIQKLLAQLDRKTQEVEIEARVVSATRNFARDIGVQLGFGWGNAVTAVGGAGSVGTSPLLVTTATAPTFFNTGGAIPLFSNLPAVGPTSGISLSNGNNHYRVDAILTMAESHGLLKILSRPRIVTQNNIGASVKQGVRIPVVTAAQLGGPPTVQYIEAALRLQVTPQITVENTIFLNVDVENTTPDFAQSVSGNPTLITQQATTQVLVTDGGTVVIGGVIQTQNSVNVTQVPLLGNIPILGNLFKERSVRTSTQELIFFITPKIVQT